MVWQHLTNLSQEQHQLIYQYAYTYYHQKDYGKACDLFRFLTIADTENSVFWMGFGASLQMLEQYQKAIEAYEMARMIDPVLIPSYLHAAECYRRLNMFKEVYDLCNEAKEVAKETKNDEALAILQQLVAQNVKEKSYGN